MNKKIKAWMISMYGCPWDDQTCTNATIGGHLEVFKWARENGCEWRTFMYAWDFIT